jgi:hypothetical protein
MNQKLCLFLMAVILLSHEAANALEMQNYAEAALKMQQRFIKIDESGAVLADDASQWSCVYDSQTQFLWEEKTDNGGLRDKDWQYTWYDTRKDYNKGVLGFSDRHDYQSARATGETCGQTLQDCNTQKYVEMVTESGGLCGKSDWRLPELAELNSLMTEKAVKHPWAMTQEKAWFGLSTKSVPRQIHINTHYFANLPQQSWYWSANTTKNDAAQANIIYFDSALIYGAPKSNNLYIRLIHKENSH